MFWIKSPEVESKYIWLWHLILLFAYMVLLIILVLPFIKMITNTIDSGYRTLSRRQKKVFSVAIDRKYFLNSSLCCPTTSTRRRHCHHHHHPWRVIPHVPTRVARGAGSWWHTRRPAQLGEVQAGSSPLRWLHTCGLEAYVYRNQRRVCSTVVR